MKKTLILVGMLAVGYANAQDYRVGINTDDPKATLHIKETIIKKNDGSEDVEYPQGVLFPKFSTQARSRFTNVTEGTLIYNTDNKCVEVSLGGTSWDCITNVETNGGASETNALQRFVLSAAGFTGGYYENVSMTGNIVRFRLKNNSVVPLLNVDFSDAVKVNIGSQSVAVDGSANNNVTLYGGATRILNYTLYGSPTAGTLTAKFDQMGLTAEQSVTIGLGNATLSDVSRTLYTHTTQDVETINNTNKLTIQIPYTGARGRYEGTSVTVNTSAGYEGDVNQLTLDIPAGNYNGSGNITATITVDGDGIYRLRRQTLGAEPYKIADFNINLNGNTSTVSLMGKTDGVVHNGYHYLWVKFRDKNSLTLGDSDVYILNHDLEAETAKIGSPYYSSDISFTYDKTQGSRGNGKQFTYTESKSANICPSGSTIGTYYRNSVTSAIRSKADDHQKIWNIMGSKNLILNSYKNDVYDKYSVRFLIDGDTMIMNMGSSDKAYIRCFKR